MTRTVDLGRFEFECGESIPRLAVAYETYGDYDGSNAVLVCHALTGGPHVASRREDGERSGGGADDGDDSTGGDVPDDQASAWWAAVVGPGRYLDTHEQFVVCANVPGSCYGTTGPASTNPETGRPYGPEFPPVTVGDWTRAQAALLDHLGIDRLQAVVGGSVGGMNVLEWIRRYPDRVERAIPVATAPRLDAQMLALNATARRAITGDPAYNGGRYYGDGPDPDHGLAVARRIGHVTYLSKGSMERRFGRRSAGRDSDEVGPGEAGPAGPGGDPTGPGGDPTARAFDYRDVESYLDHNAGTFVDRFDANSYVYLSRAMDEYDLARDHDSDADALDGFDGDVLLVSFTGDWHFPVERSERLAAAFRRAGVETTHHVVDSDYGHDAFLVEPDEVGPAIRSFLEEGRHPEGTGGQAPVHAGLFR
ncbi:homoserine O-acetyltransferase [Halobacteriales archaeon QS_8_69_26]|nr:MAG: homoserine O-acetyltransferase [Halobacteriales archaeon QS_8_69_26]